MIEHGELESVGIYEHDNYVPVKITKDVITQIANLPNVIVKIDRQPRTYHGKYCIFGVPGTRSTVHSISGVIRVHFIAKTTRELDDKIDRIKTEMVKREMIKIHTECKWISDKSKHKEIRLKGYITYPNEPGPRSTLLNSVPSYSYYIFKDGECLNARRE